MGGVININPLRYSRTDASVVDISQGVIFDTTDEDAAAYLTAAGITDPTLVSETNTLFGYLKFNNLYAKLTSLHLLLGTTPAQLKWNAINPLDTDAAHRLSFFGGLTYGSNSVIGNGTNGYIRPHLTTGVDFLQANCGVGVYAKTSSSLNNYEYSDAGGSLYCFIFYGASTNYIRGLNFSPDNYAVPNGIGFVHSYGGSGVSSTFLNGVKKLSGTGCGTITGEMYYMGNVVNYSDREDTLFFTSEYMSDAEALLFNTGITTFLTNTGKS